jgi:hypothetical protein
MGIGTFRAEEVDGLTEKLAHGGAYELRLDRMFCGSNVEFSGLSSSEQGERISTFKN